MDQMVLKTQQWLNGIYKDNSNYKIIPEDGATGWTTITALTTALQIELGISTPNGSFGPATRSAFENLSIDSQPQNDWSESAIISYQHKIFILQGALFCKGYNPGGFTGTFGTNTEAAIKQLQTDAGLSNANGVVDSILMKALLSMDAFQMLTYGEYKDKCDQKIRTIQQYLNKNYISNTSFSIDIGLVPCNGIYDRSTNKALIYALQIEEGISTPNGVFGPSTKSKCPVLSLGSTKTKFIYLLQFALYCNGKEFDPNGFDGGYGNGVKNAVTKFQSFCGLNADGIAGSQTFASLLVSTGDNTRKGTACDCSTTITDPIAATLKANKYEVVGRYLTGKFRMTSSELKIIFDNGLRVIPIFEVGGYKLSYFSYDQGVSDADSAIFAAAQLGFTKDTIIYFAVDFDALDSDVTSNVLPYFKAISEKFTNANSIYKIGIYAPRNVCSRVQNAGYSCSSFVCDMSTGFSGNLGYPLPKDWAFDQISTVTLHGNADIEIDNNISSGKNPGVNSVVPVDILGALNDNSFAKLFGVEFSTPDAEIEIFNNAFVKIAIGAAVKAALGDDSKVIKFKGGEFDGADIQTPLDNLKASLNKDNIELSTILAKAKDMELSIKTSTNGTSLKIELENSFNVPEHDTFSLSETLSIEFRVDKDKLLEDLKLAASSVVDFVKENPAIGVIICIAVVAAILLALPETALGAAIISAFSEAIEAISAVIAIA
ncbi:peptidoglycan hydrolase-like protein with peptidoglycan-binding domain [Clostridium beijerinckii]|uniref:Peptidoglycan hydrolase-like protein with peptidoglycan-binding domain n=2 Tax=Clostridium beijerinckii TaxID=1520 RepID=A0A9Q5CIJ1_CLOBE|nr:putative peptidoglycan binding domain protein [Clostridium beijerinckii]MBA2887083.1 peptidoglycan hydrolase-like protein with peptidoglycan-binding domain [Clostridium beijerinckii]MBA2901974.1 peptidoglycan hydrolase-like protein with peptidoglycan-binding domain [Clostridium beijerinckii]MBA2911797.1 peptidoglycan hydrolase-like protein with peptidoglycan-binding domain [Clostridium beijerinckii]MBA9013868.1 peptidoglycan hydrolase-like protein with peptidoglycan-binding domain [Clostridi